MPDYDWLYPYTTSDRHREVLKIIKESPTITEAANRQRIGTRRAL